MPNATSLLPALSGTESVRGMQKLQLTLGATSRGWVQTHEHHSLQASGLPLQGVPMDGHFLLPTSHQVPPIAARPPPNQEYLLGYLLTPETSNTPLSTSYLTENYTHNITNLRYASLPQSI